MSETELLESPKALAALVDPDQDLYRTGWMADGSCRTIDSDIFFCEDMAPNSNVRVARTQTARRICAACPVRSKCLTYAVLTGQEAGIWAGTTPSERIEIRRHFYARMGLS